VDFIIFDAILTNFNSKYLVRSSVEKASQTYFFWMVRICMQLDFGSSEYFLGG